MNKKLKSLTNELEYMLVNSTENELRIIHKDNINLDKALMRAKKRIEYKTKQRGESKNHEEL